MRLTRRPRAALLALALSTALGGLAYAPAPTYAKPAASNPSRTKSSRVGPGRRRPPERSTPPDSGRIPGLT